MPGYVKFWLWIAGAAVVCYMLNINPFAVLGGVAHGIQHAHQVSVTGK